MCQRGADLKLEMCR